MPEDEYLVVSQNNEATVDTAKGIALISRDARSWVNFLRMLTTGCAALMTVQYGSGRTEQIKVLPHQPGMNRPRFTDIPTA